MRNILCTTITENHKTSGMQIRLFCLMECLFLFFSGNGTQFKSSDCFYESSDSLILCPCVSVGKCLQSTILAAHSAYFTEHNDPLATLLLWQEHYLSLNLLQSPIVWMYTKPQNNIRIWDNRWMKTRHRHSHNILGFIKFLFVFIMYAL